MAHDLSQWLGIRVKGWIVEEARWVTTTPRCPTCGRALEVRRHVGTPEPELWGVLAVHTGSGKCPGKAD